MRQSKYHKFRKIRLLSCIPLFYFSFSCSSSAVSASGTFDFEITPIARLVSTADLPITDEFLHPYLYRADFRISEYDARFRRPGVNGDITLVDCLKLDAIGVMFWAHRSLRDGYGRAKTFHKPRVIWTHSATELKGPKYDHFNIRNRSFSWDVTDRPVTVYSEYLEFERAQERLDGRYTVTVFYMGNPIYKDTFDVVGCVNAS